LKQHYLSIKTTAVNGKCVCVFNGIILIS